MSLVSLLIFLLKFTINIVNFSHFKISDISINIYIYYFKKNKDFHFILLLTNLYTSSLIVSLSLNVLPSLHSIVSQFKYSDI